MADQSAYHKETSAATAFLGLNYGKFLMNTTSVSWHKFKKAVEIHVIESKSDIKIYGDFLVVSPIGVGW